MAIAFYNRGHAFEATGDHARAIQDYDQVIRLEPNNASAFGVRCYANAMLGRLAKALADCNQALRLRPGNPDTLDSRGFTYLKLKQADAAIADYDAALKADPKMAFSLYGRGVAKRMKGDTAGAMPSLGSSPQVSSSREPRASPHIGAGPGRRHPATN